jgi:hypothetical protein
MLMTTEQFRYDTTRMWLAARVRSLWELASEDLSGACRELDGLVAEYGRIRLARALADSGLQSKGTSEAAKGTDAAHAAVDGAQRGDP